MATQTQEFLGTGRRKTAVARVRIASGAGKITVNGRAFETYFPTETLRGVVTAPLARTETANKYDVNVNVNWRRPAGPGRRGAPRHRPRVARSGRQPSSRA